MVSPFASIPDKVYGLGTAGIEVLALIACILIAILSYRCYTTLKQKKFFYFSLAFFFIAVSFVARITSHLSLYVLNIQGNTLKPLLYLSFGSWFYIILTLLGYLIMLVVVSKSITRRAVLLTFCLSIVGVILSTNSFEVFHLISLIILSFLVLHQIENYFKKRRISSLFIIGGFSLIALGHLLFGAVLVLGLEYVYYIVAHVTQIGGYSALLLAMRF